MFICNIFVWSCKALLIMIVTAWGDPEMHCFLICGLAGACGVGSRGDLIVGCGHMCDGIFLGMGC